MNRYFLGVDGGQSNTTALIGDENGRVLGIGKDGPCNHVSGPEAVTKFLRVIGGCVRAAAGQAGVEPGGAGQFHFASACLGFSGGAKDKAPLLGQIFSTDANLVTHDGLIALAGATAGAPGVIVIGGTGSFSFGRNAAGKTARAGGWGYIYGDEGGGFDLTRQALRAALRAEEGWGPETQLRARLLERTGDATINDLLHRFYTPAFTRQEIAAMSTIVDQAADAGDSVAESLLVTAAEQLADYADAVRGMLFRPGEAAMVSYVGGVFKSRRLRQAFVTFTKAQAPMLGPAAGALIEAYRAAGVDVALTNVPETEK